MAQPVSASVVVLLVVAESLRAKVADCCMAEQVVVAD
jgi:hypothetical protein